VVAVSSYYVLLRNNQILRFEKQTIKNIIKIIFSTLLMSTILIYGLDYFEESMNYLNKYKSIYLIFIVSFVGTIYLISCYLLGVLKLKNYKTN
jgi:peptidoglycan biosynthesis protein MviN/MurJ (putative lipid II flippase)